MNPNDLLDNLHDNDKPSVEFCFPNGEGTFHDDTTRFRGARTILDWIQTMNETFHHTNWPAKSPSLICLIMLNLREN